MEQVTIHPGRYLLQELKARGQTQKQFSQLIGKKISELNELINGKRNITIQRDLLLSAAFDDPEGKRIHMQNQYDFYRAKLGGEMKRVQDIKRRRKTWDKHEVFARF